MMKMNNFYKFINNDIETKKSIIANLPTTTSNNIKKHNQKIKDILEKYEEYETNITKYLLAKRESFEVGNKVPKEITHSSEITDLERVCFLLNPSNTFIEKLELDILLYQLNNYSDFNFNELNNIINKFVDKFGTIGITLNAMDFVYTNYVHNYMSTFLEIKNSGSSDYSRVAKIFEEVYWTNPEFIEHIELNFRQLIQKHGKKFHTYLTSLQNDVVVKYGITSYEMCLDKLKQLYYDKPQEEAEDIKDIVYKARNNEFDISQYREDSSFKENAFSSLIPNADYSNEEAMKELYVNLNKLKENILEYKSYSSFLPLLNHFKEEYEKLLTEPYDPKTNVLRIIEGDIANQEDRLDKISKRILGPKKMFTKAPSPEEINRCKYDSIQIANELRKIYKAYDYEIFKAQILRVLSPSMTVKDLFSLYYSYSFHKLKDIKKAFNLSTYKELEAKSIEFDEFVLDPTKMIVSGSLVFSDNEVAKIIVNKYRLNDINITENDLSVENLETTIEKINLILRLKTINESTITPEKIHFITEVDQLFKTS